LATNEVKPGVFITPSHQADSKYKIDTFSRSQIGNDILDISTKSVIGTDTRIQVTDTTANPYSFTGYIYSTWDEDGDGNDDNYSYCTGFMEGPDVLITAAHCVYDSSNNGWNTSLKYDPARNGETTPYESAYMTEISISQQWVTYHDWNYDWAIIILDRNVGGTTGWYGKGWSSGSLNGYDISLTGYPLDKAVRTMWTATGEINQLILIYLDMM
jgi:glutamyl endopeptidase